MKCFECKNKTDLFVSKEGMLIIKGKKGIRLNYSDIAMITIHRWKKMKIITTTHQIYTLKFSTLETLDTAINDLCNNGVQVLFVFGTRGI